MSGDYNDERARPAAPAWATIPTTTWQRVGPDDEPELDENGQVRPPIPRQGGAANGRGGTPAPQIPDRPGTGRASVPTQRGPQNPATPPAGREPRGGRSRGGQPQGPYPPGSQPPLPQPPQPQAPGALPPGSHGPYPPGQAPQAYAGPQQPQAPYPPGPYPPNMNPPGPYPPGQAPHGPGPYPPGGAPAGPYPPGGGPRNPGQRGRDPRQQGGRPPQGGRGPVPPAGGPAPATMYAGPQRQPQPGTPPPPPGRSTGRPGQASVDPRRSTPTPGPNGLPSWAGPTPLPLSAYAGPNRLTGSPTTYGAPRTPEEAPVTAPPYTAPVTGAPVSHEAGGHRVGAHNAAPDALVSGPISGIPVSGVPGSGAPVSAPTAYAGSTVVDQPVSAVPISATPASSAPASAVPASAVPSSGAPASGFLVPAKPVSGIPASGVPASAVPVSGVPVSGAPVSGVPASAVPVSATPASSVPASGVPVSSTPVSGTPVSSTPASAAPISAPPAPAAPDPEQILGSFEWVFDPETLREVNEDPDGLIEIRDMLTAKINLHSDNASRARLLSLRAVVSRIAGDLSKALADAKLALAHAEATGELRRVAICQARLAHVLQWRGEFAEADRLFAEANSSELPDRLRGTMHQHTGKSAYDQGRYIEACNHFEKALELRKEEDPDLMAATELALDAVFRKVAVNGWGPYPRTREEILQIHKPPTPALDEKSGLWGFAGAEGETRVLPAYADVQPFRDGAAWVRRPEFETWELIDETGGSLIPPHAGYLGVSSFSGSLSWVSRDGNGSWIAIDKSGAVTISTGFDDVRPFRRGIAAVRRGRRWGAVDGVGRVIVPFQFEGFSTALSDGRYIDGFSDEGLAVVGANGRKGVVDRSGKMIVEPVFTSVVIHPVAFLITDDTGRWGALDRKGRILIDPAHPSRISVTLEIDRLLADAKPVL